MAGGGHITWRSHDDTPKRDPSGSGGPPGGGGPPNYDACDIRLETTLNSIDPTAIQKINRGDRLTIREVMENAVSRIVAELNGQRLGVISHPKTLEMIACIRSGNQYEAVVVERQGGLCRICVERISV